jgi:hypothetical protein
MSGLQDFKDNLSRMATGMTKSEAHHQGVCIECKQPEPMSRCHTELGRKEYYISGICEECWDKMFEGGDDDAA